MKLLACPECARPYDVHGLDPGTRLRCVCGGRLQVGAADPIAGGVTCGHCGAPVPEGHGTCQHCNAALLTRRCPHCAATSPEGSLHCCRCGQALVCQGLRPLPDEARCPRCQGDLGLRILPNGSVIECPACSGVWLEPTDLERMVREAATSAGPGMGGAAHEAPSHPLAYLPCVRCGELMQRRQYQWAARPSGIVLDHCRDHGVWLDGGELEAVLVHVRSHPADGSAQASRTLPPIPVQISAAGQGASTARGGGLLGAFLESVAEVFSEDLFRG